jgi:hypothetical protein
MTTTNTISKVRNYQGNNTFVIKMKDVIAKYGSLTANQEMAVEKCLNADVKSVDVESLPEELKVIAKYEGESTFVKDIKEKLLKYGTLTQRQVEAVNKTIQKEKDKSKTINVRWSTPGETVILGRTIGQQLKEKYGLNFNPMVIDLTKLLSVTPKAVKFAGKMTVKRNNVCVVCSRTLTDEFSMVTNMGKTCAGHVGVEYITDVNQVDKFRNEYLKKVEEIGEMEFWVPRAQIKKWEGRTEKILRAI